jgi:hypothetical protein
MRKLVLLFLSVTVYLLYVYNRESFQIKPVVKWPTPMKEENVEVELSDALQSARRLFSPVRQVEFVNTSYDIDEFPEAELVTRPSGLDLSDEVMEQEPSEINWLLSPMSPRMSPVEMTQEELEDNPIYFKGFTRGYTTGLDEGYTKGNKSGFRSGYNFGYERGLEDC